MESPLQQHQYTTRLIVSWQLDRGPQLNASQWALNLLQMLSRVFILPL
jgi:hypothetical protein